MHTKNNDQTFKTNGKCEQGTYRVVHTKKFAHSASIRREFSEGLTLDRLVDRYSAQKFKKKFTSLEPKKQIEVYGAIIEAAECSTKLVESISKIEGAII